ncbi:hypothetical protein ACEWY4_002281 [Coilia grayii]|uniref:THAP-type domain-containing protein n=1 Tax=Coilia grayii TaxID=363190 RepID=A0ABD1KWL2_9TELE
MPRYCAVKLCKNRGGVLSKDNKRISFYPFPLRDQTRLQKWVDNMKRQAWTPSRHQYLCSEHFTEDSFDLRWGIRYLKHTAVPTIFPYICDDENGKIHNKKNSKARGRVCSTGIQEVFSSLSPPRKKSLILKENDLNNSSSSSSSSSSGTVCRLRAEGSGEDGQVFSVLLVGHLKLETAVCPEQEQDGVPSLVQTPSDDPPDRLLLDARVKGEMEEPVCAPPAVAVPPCEPPPLLTDSTPASVTVAKLPPPLPLLTDSSASATVADSLQTCLGPSRGVARRVCVEGEGLQWGEEGHREVGVLGEEHHEMGVSAAMTEEARGAGKLWEKESGKGHCEVGVSEEGHREVGVAGEGCLAEEVEGEQACLWEHSYSRQDLDKEQLWGRIAALHAKMAALEQREDDTLARIRATEAQLAQLRKHNIVCQEKQKALEDYFTSVFL